MCIKSLSVAIICIVLQAVREADAAVEQANENRLQLEAALREANSRVSELIADLARLQQSQSKQPVMLQRPLPSCFLGSPVPDVANCCQGMRALHLSSMHTCITADATFTLQQSVVNRRQALVYRLPCNSCSSRLTRLWLRVSTKDSTVSSNVLKSMQKLWLADSSSGLMLVFRSQQKQTPLMCMHHSR